MDAIAQQDGHVVAAVVGAGEVRDAVAVPIRRGDARGAAEAAGERRHGGKGAVAPVPPKAHGARTVVARDQLGTSVEVEVHGVDVGVVARREVRPWAKGAVAAALEDAQ